RVRAETTKTRRERHVPFDIRTQEHLMEYLLERKGSADGSLFMMSSNAIRLCIQALAVRAEVTCASHDFRRGFAARARAAGMDIGHVMRILGHSTPRMTLMYSEAGEDQASFDSYRNHID